MSESEAQGKLPFGVLLRRHRIAAALSQEALAERAGLSAAAIQALERGRRGAPRPDTITRLAEALELDPADRRILIAALPDGAEQAAPAPPPAATVTEPPPSATVRDEPVAGFLGSRPGGLLVARARELTTLFDALTAASKSEGRTVLLAGGAGVGKTRIAQEVTREARSRGFLVATGCCYETEQSVPYYPFLDVIATAYEAAPVTLRELATVRWPHLGALLPNHLPVPEGGRGSDDQKNVLFAASAFLAAVSAFVPLAICLDDLHWADSGSLRLLRHLAHHLCSSPVLILGAYRDASVNDDHPLCSVIRDLGREELLEQLVIRPLEEAETRELVAALAAGQSIPNEVVHLVHQRTEGNPFFVHQLLRQLNEYGASGSSEPGWTARALNDVGVPQTVRAVIGQRVRGLSETAQETLREASVLGQSFTYDDLAGMSSRGEDAVGQGLDEAEQIGLVREVDRSIYNFDHNLTQQAIYQDLSTQRRRSLHRAAARSIEKLPERKRERRAAELAWHFLEGNETERAIPYALLAGDRAEAVFAHVEAEQHYRTALRLARENEDDAAIVQACEKLAAPLHHSGHFDDALAALEEAAAYYEARGDLTNLIPLMAEIAGVHGNRGTPQEGMARLDPLMARLAAETPSAGLIYLYASQGSLLFVLGRAEEHLAVARHSTAAAETLGDVRALAVAKEQLGLALLSMRLRDEARVVLDDAMALAEKAGDLTTLSLALNNAAYAAELRGELARSIGLFQRGLELAQHLGNPAQTAFMLYALSRNHLESGDWQRARDFAEQAVVASREIGASWVAPYPLLGLGRILLALNDPRALTAIEEGLSLAEGNDDLQARDLALCFLTEFDLARDAPEPALTRLREAGVAEAWKPAQVGVSLGTALALARTLAALRRQAAARAVLDRVIDQARRAGEMLVLAEALPLNASLLLEAQDWSGAEAAFYQAVSLAQTVTYPYAEAEALRGAGALHLGKGEAETGRERLREALTIYQRLGAPREIEAVELTLSGPTIVQHGRA